MTKHCDAFMLDDLLCAAAQDIVLNGFESSTLPAEIKSWIATKLINSLPKPLIQKLLSFILENRNVAENIGYFENSTGTEFTISIYNSMRHRLREEATSLAMAKTKGMGGDRTRTKSVSRLEFQNTIFQFLR